MTTSNRMFSTGREAADRKSAVLAWEKVPHCFLVFLFLAASALLPATGYAVSPIDTTPKLRLEVGTHTAMIRRMAVDASGDRVVTVSDDKTIRIWSLSQLRLHRTARIPLGDGNEGRIFALGLHEDLIAAGGWTAIEWGNHSAVYLASAVTGEILGRIYPLGGAVSSLRFSAEGRVLAIGASGGGIGAVYFADVATRTVVAKDTSYGGEVRGIDYHSDVGFVTTSSDGQIRVYGRDLSRTRQARLDVGRTPSFVRFSPDGEKILVGFVDVPSVAVVDSTTLAPIFSRSVSDDTTARNLPGVAWGPSGDSIYAIGDSSGPSAVIRRWSGTGDVLPGLSVAAQRLTALEVLDDGQLVLTSEDPRIVVVDNGGTISRSVEPQVIRFEGLADTLRLNHDATEVAFKAHATDKTFSVFSLAQRALNANQAPDDAFSSPVQSSSNTRVTNWKDTQAVDNHPLINGRPAELDRYDISRAAAVARDGSGVVIGSDWGLYFFDRDARLLWRTSTAEVVWGVNVSRDGTAIVAAHSDGTLRWYRVGDGKEYFAAYVRPDESEWVAWTPEGYYTSSPNGDRFIGWHINRGVAETPDFYRAVQFERVLFRPDIVQDYFAARGRLQPGNPDLASIAPPRIRLSRLTTMPKGGIDRAQAVFQIDVEKNSLTMRDFGIYINNVPVTPASERELRSAERDRFEREIIVDLNEPDNSIRIEVFNGTSMGLMEQYVAGPTRRIESGKGDLYLFAVGANRFDNAVRCADPAMKGAYWPTLRFASQDAVAVKDLFLGMEGEVFNAVHWRLLSDSEGPVPTRANIEKHLDFVKQAGPDDTVVIFLASHGITNDKGNYYFVPRDGSVEDACRLMQNRDDIDTYIGWEVFFDALRVTAGRRLMIIDTCHAGDMQIDEKFDAFSMTKRSTASSFALMSAATGSQESQEYSKGGQGLFTYAMLDAVRKGVDDDGDGWTTLREVFDYAKPFVEANREDLSKEQTPVLVDPRPLGATRLGRAPVHGQTD